MLKWLPVGMDAKAPMSNAAAAIMVARPCCPAILSILRSTVRTFYAQKCLELATLFIYAEIKSNKLTKTAGSLPSCSLHY